MKAQASLEVEASQALWAQGVQGRHPETQGERERGLCLGGASRSWQGTGRFPRVTLVTLFPSTGCLLGSRAACGLHQAGAGGLPSTAAKRPHCPDLPARGRGAGLGAAVLASPECLWGPGDPLAWELPVGGSQPRSGLKSELLRLFFLE